MEVCATSKNYSVARVVQHTQAGVGKFERHIERKNESYENMNVELSRTHLNVHFKSCGEGTYNQTLDKLVEEGKVSLRGLKKDAKVFDEIIFDVNTEYFEEHGGYEYACRFYEEAYHFAEKEYGPDNILSAVLHADEQNAWLSQAMDKPVYHYHLHVMALPVVEKEIKWSKRCKDPALRGTVKDVIHQISHSKKWASQKIVDEQGQVQIIKSYTLLQDRFFQHMQAAGFTDFQRGERGSTREHLSVLDYKVQQDQRHLAEMEKEIAEANKEMAKTQQKLEVTRQEHATYSELEHMGRKTLGGKVQLSPEEFGKLTGLAKEGIASRGKIGELEDRVQDQSRKIWKLVGAVQEAEQKLEELQEKCQPFLYALEHFPQLVRGFTNRLRQLVWRQEGEQPEYQPARKNKDYDR